MIINIKFELLFFLGKFMNVVDNVFVLGGILNNFYCVKIIFFNYSCGNVIKCVFIKFFCVIDFCFLVFY